MSAGCSVGKTVAMTAGWKASPLAAQKERRWAEKLAAETVGH